MSPLPLPASAKPFLPHQPPMAMVETILANDTQCRKASLVIRPGNLFLNGDGVLDPAVIPELVAQAAAAAETHRNGGTVSAGFLALGRDIQIPRPPRVNEELFITATDESPLDGWFVINFTMFLADGTTCATGEISVCRI